MPDDEVTQEVTEPVVSETAPTTVEAAPDPFDNESEKTFTREYVAKLRQEAASRRTAIKPFEESFSGWDEGDREVWLDISRNVVSDPATAVKQLQEVVRLLGGGELTPQKVQVADEDVVDPDDVPLTRKEYQELVKQERIKGEVQKIESEAGSLGYTKGTAEYRHLIDVAMNETKGDLTAAHKAIESSKESIIAAYLEAKAKEGGITPAFSGGSPPAGATTPKTFADARNATFRLLGGK